ncbi:hypothetical protein KXD96_18685 [Mycobacterium sp. SMC-2]|uniref:hypothetical protein n=1 Tax=Mycobacterium sp. SMC-2 TaxID=2857058 RepID=UPI0021B4A7DE|nr:hypothetical protein [Mycobacterium sp. SMC-2]UXA04995.1 hypothetical protein KXD96_18685 [Mycobacterium sp. SMC-2]
MVELEVVVCVVDDTDDEVVGGALVSVPQEVAQSVAAAAMNVVTTARPAESFESVGVIATSARGIPVERDTPTSAVKRGAYRGIPAVSTNEITRAAAATRVISLTDHTS